MHVPFKLIEASRAAAATTEFARIQQTAVLPPERGLILAILQDALACYLKDGAAGSGKKRSLSREAEKWIWNTKGDWVFSFENICGFLGLNPDYIRQRLLRLKERELAGRPSAKVYSLTGDKNVKQYPEHPAYPICMHCEAKRQLRISNGG